VLARILPTNPMRESAWHLRDAILESTLTKDTDVQKTCLKDASRGSIHENRMSGWSFRLVRRRTEGRGGTLPLWIK